jgi:ubiquinone/menaquinone biosynthesis C-methylase UbiE
VLEVACGRGRHAPQLLKLASPSKYHLSDINKSNIDWCRKRFGGNPLFEYHPTDGVSFP